MTLEQFQALIQQSPESIQFQEVMGLVAEHYEYTPCRFHNGLGADRVSSEAGQNEGSCKIFALAQQLGLDAQQTLHCFGDYYRIDVLGKPEGSDHANIRSFMRHGWDGISFEGTPLTPRT